MVVACSMEAYVKWPDGRMKMRSTMVWGFVLSIGAGIVVNWVLLSYWSELCGYGFLCIRNSQVKFWRTTYYLGIEIEGLFCSQLPSSFRYQLFYLTLSHLAKILKLRLLNFLLFNYRKRRKIYWFDSWETGVVPDQEKCFGIGWLFVVPNCL